MHFSYTCLGQFRRCVLVADPKTNRPLILKFQERIESFLEQGKQTPFHEWMSMMEQKGMVDYIDPREVDSNAVRLGPALGSVWFHTMTSIADSFNYKFTHFEITPDAILGPTAASLIHLAHQQGPRNLFMCSHEKSSTATPSLNHRHRVMGKLHILTTPQKRFVNSHAARMFGIEELSNSSNVVIAVMPLQGFGIEDNFQSNRAFHERGGMHTVIVREYSIFIPESDSDADGTRRIQNPSLVKDCEEAKSRNYSKLPTKPTCVCGIDHKKYPAPTRHCIMITSGVPPVHTRMEPGEVIVGVVAFHANGRCSDQSLRVANQEPGKAF